MPAYGRWMGIGALGLILWLGAVSCDQFFGNETRDYGEKVESYAGTLETSIQQLQSKVDELEIEVQDLRSELESHEHY